MLRYDESLREASASELGSGERKANGALKFVHFLSTP
jgi:hypothetical protein